MLLHLLFVLALSVSGTRRIELSSPGLTLGVGKSTLILFMLSFHYCVCMVLSLYYFIILAFSLIFLFSCFIIVACCYVIIVLFIFLIQTHNIKQNDDMMDYVS